MHVADHHTPEQLQILADKEHRKTHFLRLRAVILTLSGRTAPEIAEALEARTSLTPTSIVRAPTWLTPWACSSSGSACSASRPRSPIRPRTRQRPRTPKRGAAKQSRAAEAIARRSSAHGRGQGQPAESGGRRPTDEELRGRLRAKRAVEADCARSPIRLSGALSGWSRPEKRPSRWPRMRQRTLESPWRPSQAEGTVLVVLPVPHRFRAATARAAV
jgi:hypothetical protein